MNITKEKKDDRLVIFIDGKLDTLTSPQLDAELKSAFEETDTVEVNMENLAYISSAGLRVLHSGASRAALHPQTRKGQRQAAYQPRKRHRARRV